MCYINSRCFQIFQNILRNILRQVSNFIIECTINKRWKVIDCLIIYNQIFSFTIEFNWWKWFCNSFKISGYMVWLQKKKHETQDGFSWNLKVWIIRPHYWWWMDQVFDSFIFWKLVLLIFCHQIQTWSPTLKLSYFLQCPSTFSLCHLCAFKKLNTSCVQVFAKVSTK
jgi:hypothetical protein